MQSIPSILLDPDPMATPPRDVLGHLVDVHCHPTEQTEIPDDLMSDLPIKVCAMASGRHDQEKVADLVRRFPDKVIPCFGFHPWFYHEISLKDPVPSKEDHYREVFMTGGASKEAEFQQLLPALAEPTSLKDVAQIVRSNLSNHPTALLGEVGLDRSFRIAYQPLPAPPPRKLSPFSTPIDHQVAILEAQLDIAVELKRNVSLHSVGSQQVTMDLLKRMHERHGEEWRTISVDLHSCGLSLEGWKTIEKNYPNIFLSLSDVINSRSENHVHLIKGCAEDRLLAESDYDNIQHSVSQTWKMVERIADLRGWEVEASWEEEAPPLEKWGVVRRLERNWLQFQAGNHPEIVHKSRRLRKQHQYYPSDESEEE